MKIVVVSLKFNTGHLTSFLGLKRLADLAEHEILFFLDKTYQKYLKDTELVCIYDLAHLSADIDALIIYNISSKDWHIIRYMKKLCNPKIAFVYHEPWRGWKQEILRFKKAPYILCKAIMRGLFALDILKNADLIICPSEQSKSIYSKNQIKLNHHCEIFPLLFPDETNGRWHCKKKYFSFVATAMLDKGIDRFFAFVKYAAVKDENIAFQVVTKTDISNYLDDEIKSLQAQGRIYIQHGRDLSVEEINTAYNQSRITWLVYRSSTQSGVIIKALMWGSPCIATNVGVFGEQIDGNNGILVENIDDFEAIYQAYQQIDGHFDDFSVCARKSFEKYYWTDSHVELYQQMIERLMESDAR